MTFTKIHFLLEIKNVNKKSLRPDKKSETFFVSNFVFVKFLKGHQFLLTIFCRVSISEAVFK